MEEKYKREYSKNGNILNNLDNSILRIRNEIQEKGILLNEMESDYNTKSTYCDSLNKKIKGLKNENISIK